MHAKGRLTKLISLYLIFSCTLSAAADLDVSSESLQEVFALLKNLPAKVTRYTAGSSGENGEEKVGPFYPEEMDDVKEFAPISGMKTDDVIAQLLGFTCVRLKKGPGREFENYICVSEKMTPENRTLVQAILKVAGLEVRDWSKITTAEARNIFRFMAENLNLQHYPGNFYSSKIVAFGLLFIQDRHDRKGKKLVPFHYRVQKSEKFTEERVKLAQNVLKLAGLSESNDFLKPNIACSIPLMGQE